MGKVKGRGGGSGGGGDRKGRDILLGARGTS